ncbi:hypothetical protein JYT31_02110 [Beggiatoa alba]|nr:hypothetical protein [Beggiatoa alba]
MPQISLYGEHSLSVESVTRLLQDETSFKLQCVKSQCEYKQFLRIHDKQDAIVYCSSAYSNALFKNLEKLQRDAPTLKKILIMPIAHKHFLQKILDTGIDSIVSSRSSATELIQAIQFAIDGQQYLSSDLNLMVFNSEDHPSSFNALSKRELEITCMLANGMNVKNVSSALDISPKTVNTYRYRIFNKLAIERNIDLFYMVSKQAAYMLNS